MAWRPEHYFGARRQTFRRVRSQIVWAEIRFHLDNASDALRTSRYVDQIFSEQVFCNCDGVTIVEIARELMEFQTAPPLRVRLLTGGFVPTRGQVRDLRASYEFTLQPALSPIER
jgi:hypothetical protein